MPSATSLMCDWTFATSSTRRLISSASDAIFLSANDSASSWEWEGSGCGEGKEGERGEEGDGPRAGDIIATGRAWTRRVRGVAHQRHLRVKPQTDGHEKARRVRDLRLAVHLRAEVHHRAQLLLPSLPHPARVRDERLPPIRLQLRLRLGRLRGREVGLKALADEPLVLGDLRRARVALVRGGRRHHGLASGRTGTPNANRAGSPRRPAARAGGRFRHYCDFFRPDRTPVCAAIPCCTRRRARLFAHTAAAPTRQRRRFFPPLPTRGCKKPSAPPGAQRRTARRTRERPRFGLPSTPRLASAFLPFPPRLGGRDD
jgi:hypothetical protein